MNLIPDEPWPDRGNVPGLLAGRGADPSLPEPELLRAIPESLMERYQVVALSESPDRMQVGMVDPLDVIARDDLRLILGLEIEPVLVPRELVRRCLEKLRGQPYPMPPGHFRVKARMLGRVAVVEVWLSFPNPCKHDTELDFLFPIPRNAQLKSFELTCGSRRVRSEVRGRADCPQSERGPWLTLGEAGLRAEAVAIGPGAPVEVRLEYLETLTGDLFRFPLLELAGSRGELCLQFEDRPRQVGSNQPGWLEGSRFRLSQERLGRDLLVRWEPSARPRLYTEGGYFLAAHVQPGLIDRGLNFLPESLVVREDRVLGRHLGSGGLQDLTPEVIQEVGLALLWGAQQREPSLAMATQLGLLTTRTALVLVDERGEGGCVPCERRIELAGREDEPIVRVVDAVLTQAVLEGASSIHLRFLENRFAIMFRTSGRLHEAMTPPTSLMTPIFLRLMKMAELPPDLDRSARGGLELAFEGHEMDCSLYYQPTPRPQMVLTLTPRLTRQLPVLGRLEPRGLSLVAAPDFRVREQLLADFMLDLKGITLACAERAPSGILTARSSDDLEALAERVDADNLLVEATLTPELARALLRLGKRLRVVLFLRSETALQAVEELALLGDPWWTADVLEMVVVAGPAGVEMRRTDEAARDCLRSANWRFRLRGAGVW